MPFEFTRLASFLLMLWACGGWASIVSSQSFDTQNHNICDRAAKRASEATGVPFQLLQAIARTESGRRIDGRLSPWPWTANLSGRGYWFGDPHEALDQFAIWHQDGEDSFDIGCFQINTRWHGDAFASFEEMISPEGNALYAAQFLKSLHEEFDDWDEAVGAYHSRTDRHAKRYRLRVLSVLHSLPNNPVELASQNSRDGVAETLVSVDAGIFAGFGSVRAGTQGSLVPEQGAQRAAFIPFFEEVRQ